MASCRLLRLNTDLGKHGDTGDSELHVVRAVAEGEANAGALSAAYFSAFRAESVPAVADLEVVWRSPEYYHCNFTVLDSLDREVGRAVVEGAAGDGLRRLEPAPGDGPGGSQALVSRGSRGIRVVAGGDAGAGAAVVTVDRRP